MKPVFQGGSSNFHSLLSPVMSSSYGSPTWAEERVAVTPDNKAGAPRYATSLVTDNRRLHISVNSTLLYTVLSLDS
jgi:hypothetical protein